MKEWRIMEKIKRKYRTRNILGSTQAYEKIKQTLMNDLDYTEDEIEYNVVKDILIIKSIIIIAWDDKSQEYCFSISVTIEPFGFSCLLSYLFKHGFFDENILALKQKLMQTNIEDKVIISFSGHGMVDNTNNEFYFVTSKTNASDPSKEGVSYSDLEDLLDSIPARKKLMLLDACHSGESEEGVVSNETINKEGSRGNSSDDLNKDNNSGVELIDILQDVPQNQATATSVFKLMKEAFVDIRRNNGAYVISGSQSNESALENNQVSNGVFTHAILDIMQQNPAITVNELNVLVNKKVTELTQGNQNTANRQELSDFNWKLW